MAKEFTLEELEALEPKEYSLDEIESLGGNQKPNGLGKAFAESLPAAGAMFGGALGLASPIPGGAYTGAGIGAATGKALENVAEKYLFNEPKEVSDIYVSPITEGISGATGEMAGPIVGKALSGVGTALKKTVSSMSSIPEKAIETYMKRPKAVKEIGGLTEATGLQDAADTLRSNARAAIQDFKSDANEKISDYLSEHGDKLIDVSNLKKIGEETIKKLDPAIKSHQQQALKIRDMLDQITQMQVDEKLPFVPTSRLQSMKDILQDAANYDDLGNVLQKKDIMHSAFSRMSNRARIDIAKEVPGIESINKKLAQLHNVNKHINKNLLSPEQTALSVMGVGSGENQQAIKQMKKLESITGFPYVQEAENIASAKHFNKPSLLPTTGTGRSALPVLLGGFQAVNQLLQGNVGPAFGGLAFGSLGSPMAIKGGMEIGLKAQKTPQFIKSAISESIKRAVQMGMPAHLIDEQVKKSDLLKPTEKAEMRRNLVK